MPKFFGSAEALPSRKLPFHHSPIAIRYSPFTIRCLFTSRQSLSAIRCRFSRPADLPTSQFA
jgi:hypothetical protein